jgi:glucose/arabinose dehydrogenase
MATLSRFVALRGGAGCVAGAILIGGLLVSTCAARFAARQAPGQPAFHTTMLTLPDGSRHTLHVATGLRLSLYATGLQTPRFMARGPRGAVFVGSWAAGVLTVLLPPRRSGQAERAVRLLSGLDIPHSVVYHHGRLYLAEQGQISVMRYDPDHVRVYDRHALIAGLPTGGRHMTRTIVFGPDGMLYVSIGSSCNVCMEKDPRRATIMQYRPDGSGGQIYAHGLRNAVGLAWQPGTGLLWATVNGRDLLGDTAPPDTLDLIRRGGNYGWPYCWGNRQPDPDVRPAPGYCARTLLPTMALPAHVAPLGLAFSAGSRLPARYRSGLFVAYHGSWNRTRPSGYKLVYFPVRGHRVRSAQDVVTGWLTVPTTYSAWGRPVGVLIAADGSLLLSDDKAGVVYRLAAAGS